MIIYANAREVIVLRNDSLKAEYAETRDLDNEYERYEVENDAVVTFQAQVICADPF